MTFALDEAVVLLSRTPPLVDAWLRGLPDAWLRARASPDSWSPFDVVGHFIHGEETDWIPRALIILQQGETRPFEPFDRFAQFERSRGRSIGELLDTFAALRSRNLDALTGFGLTEADLARTGRHPEFGTVTLGQLLAAWVVHDLTHVRQIARAMAQRYGRDAGPWKAYLGILRD